VEQKICKIAQTIYGAANVEYSDRAKKKLAQFAEWGYGGLPICVAKTQYSLSDNPNLPGAPIGWTLHISDVRLSAGAGFLVAVSGSIMLMPGLPKDPRAFEINVDEAGEIPGPL
jgi:formate--tetrahydrofolate ligase